MKPCLTCGEPTPSSYCDEHAPRPWQHREGSARARGYDATWDKLSKRARALQPFCSLCHSTEDLTTDHLPRAWRRKAEGKVIRLKDVRVLCSPCNVDAGTSRPEDDQGTGALDASPGPRGKAQTPSHSGSEGGGTDLTTDDLDPSMRRAVDQFATVADDQDTVVSDLEGRAVGVLSWLPPVGEDDFERHVRSLP